MKHVHQNDEFRLNEILFEHRNKEYGAYVLRSESDRILTKSLFVGISLLAAISITPMVISAFKATEVAKPKPPVIYYLHPVDPIDPVTPIKKPEVPHIQQSKPVKTYDNTVPEPKADVTNEKVVEKIEGAVAGIRNNSEGETAGTEYHPTIPNVGTGPAVPYVQPTISVTPKAGEETPETIVDVEADFVGGIDAFRNKVMNGFDGSGFDDSDVMKTTITFIVEKDGSISGIKADGKNTAFNNEAIRTIKSIKGKWVPAKIKGRAVRSYFKFPISMKFSE